MFVSFVVATYNVVDLVPVFARTIEELCDIDCEFCISDGGSTDGTLEHLKQLARVRVVCSERDRGIYDAWNKALPFCEGEFISFIGIDDRPMAEFLQRARKLINRADTRPLLIYGDRYLTRGQLQRRLRGPNKPRLIEGDRPIFDIPHQGALNCRSLFRTERFDESLRLAGDLDLYLRVREQIRQGPRYMYLPIPQVVASSDGLSRSATSFGCYLDEYSRIEGRYGLRLGYSKSKLRLLRQFEKSPRLLETIKSLSWAIRHER